MGGCVSSTTFLNQQGEEEDELMSRQHIVSLTSTTYGCFLTSLDPPTRFTLGSSSHFNPIPDPKTPPPPLEVEVEEEEEVINSWELMAGLLDSTPPDGSFRFPTPPPPPFLGGCDENSNPNLFLFEFDYHNSIHKSTAATPTPTKPPPLTCSSRNSCNQIKDVSFKTHLQEEEEAKTKTADSISYYSLLDAFEYICPPKGENKVVIYTTSLRGIRKTFEDCNAVRAAFQGLGIAVCERDISMDRSFREELRELMKGKETTVQVPVPRVFVKGRYFGGADEVMKILEDGCLRELLHGLPKFRPGHVCQGCGDIRFLPCFSCNGSCKMVNEDHESQQTTLVMRCPDCNENGLVLCPICT